MFGHFLILCGALALSGCERDGRKQSVKALGSPSSKRFAKPI